MLNFINKRFDSRSLLIIKNIIASILLKVWSGATVFLLAPITLLCIGPYTNGVWITISSLLVWIDMMDIGLGNGLRNKLAYYMAQGDREKARNVVSSTFFALICIILPVIALLLLIVNNIDLYSALNVEVSQVPDLQNAISVAIILIGSTFIFKFIGNLYMGLQLPSVNNLIVTAGQTVSLLSTYAIYYLGYHSLIAVCLVNTASPLLIWLLAYPITFGRRYPWLAPSLKHFHKDAVREIASIGVSFFVIQIGGMMLFMTSGILISRWFTPESVTPYNLAYRYCSIVLLLFTIISTPIWSATTDAFASKDWAWINKASHSMTKVVLIIFAMLMVMVLLSDGVYYIWINKWQNQDIDIPLLMTLIMAAYQFIIIVSQRYSYFLNGMGALRLQLWTTLSAAVLYIPVAWLLVEYFENIYGLMLAMCLVNLPGLIINRIQFHKILSNSAHGIWRIR